jgi:hypothetical protein
VGAIFGRDYPVSLYLQAAYHKSKIIILDS